MQLVVCLEPTFTRAQVCEVHIHKIIFKCIIIYISLTKAKYCCFCIFLLHNYKYIHYINSLFYPVDQSASHDFSQLSCTFVINFLPLFIRYSVVCFTQLNFVFYLLSLHLTKIIIHLPRFFGYLFTITNHLIT